MKPLNAILGCVRISFDEKDRARVANILLRENLSSEINEHNYIEVPLFRLKRYKNAFSGMNVIHGEIRGIPGIAVKNKSRFGVFAAMAVLAVYYILAFSVVWDVRVEGSSPIDEYEIRDELYSSGLRVGSFWRSISRDKVESDVLSSSDRIGWINVNRRGTVAYVKVGEKNSTGELSSNNGYSNIVASEDGVIEEISVKSGIAMVKAGDTVSKGQLLISGIIPEEKGGGFVKAEGEVIGRIYREAAVTVNSVETETVREQGEMLELNVKIFNFPINIYKNYGKIKNEYAIIESEESIVLFNSVRLPLAISKKYSEINTERVISRNDTELSAVASRRLAAIRMLKLSDAELLKISTEGAFSDGGYTMRSKMTVLADIGEEKYFVREKGAENG